jgi:hypothetical protein
LNDKTYSGMRIEDKKQPAYLLGYAYGSFTISIWHLFSVETRSSTDWEFSVDTRSADWEFYQWTLGTLIENFNQWTLGPLIESFINGH